MSNPDSQTVNELMARTKIGDRDAADQLFAMYRDRLKQMVRLRIHRKAQGRFDESDVIQDVFAEASRKLDDYLAEPILPFYLWVRRLACLKLAELHRKHLRTEKRDAENEVSIYRPMMPGATTAMLAAQLMGRITSPSQAAIRAETRLRVQEALDEMDAIDREILALRHFEQLSTSESAEVLGLSKSGAGSRYLRAIKRLKQALGDTPTWNEDC